MSEIKAPNRQVLRSKQMLQDSLFDLLQSKPYKRISISEITDHAGLARSTFYAHFETKDDLLIYCVDDLFRDFSDKITSKPDGDQEDAQAVQIATSMFQKWAEQKVFIEHVENNDFFDIVFNRLKIHHFEIYKNIISPLAPQLNPALAEYFINFTSSATVGLLRQWTKEKMRQPPELMGNLLHELTNPATLKRIANKFGSSF